MESVIKVLAALGQQTRLDVLALLCSGPTDGRTSGEIASMAGVPANSMSTHLKVLAEAELVTSARSGRQKIYRVEHKVLDELLDHLNAIRRAGGAPDKTAVSPVIYLEHQGIRADGANYSPRSFQRDEQLEPFSVTISAYPKHADGAASDANARRNITLLTRQQINAAQMGGAH